MNRKVKSIVNVAVAMGYGELTDYHGNSVAEVLDEFAAIAAQGGGGSGGAFVVTENEGTLNKTWQEIYSALLTNPVIVVVVSDEGDGAVGHREIYRATSGKGEYSVELFAYDSAQHTTYVTNAPTGYPTITA